MKKLLTSLLIVTAGCSTLSPDTSPSAVQSGDLSLVETACSPIPTKGMDICRQHEGDPINSNWTLYVPWMEDAISAEARIKYGDKTLTYKITDFSVDIPWKDIFGPTWNKSGLVQALVTIKTKDRIVQALGYAFIVILKPGYDPTPTSSLGAITMKTCSIEYTTAGRSRILCTKP